MRHLIFALLISFVLFGCREKTGYVAPSTTPPQRNTDTITFTRNESAEIVSELFKIEVDAVQPGDTIVNKTTKHPVTETDSAVSYATFKIIAGNYKMVTHQTQELHEVHLGEIIFYKEKFYKNMPYPSYGWGDQEITVQLFFDKSKGFYGIVSNRVAMYSGEKPAFGELEAMETFLAN